MRQHSGCVIAIDANNNVIKKITNLKVVISIEIVCMMKLINAIITFITH